MADFRVMVTGNTYPFRPLPVDAGALAEAVEPPGDIGIIDPPEGDMGIMLDMPPGLEVAAPALGADPPAVVCEYILSVIPAGVIAGHFCIDCR